MAVTAYQNFDLLITRSGEEYRAFVVDAPGGDADATFALPFTADELDFLGDLAGVRRGVRPDRGGAKADLKEMGALLYGTVFQGKIAAVLAASLEKAEQEQIGLRLRLRFSEETSELATLPWEILYDPVQERFLALSESSPILRYLSLPKARPTLLVKPPLRVLAVLVSPPGYDELDVEREWQVLETALAALVADGKFVLDRLERPTFAALQERLLGDDIHILHFVGHGVYDETRGAGALVLADEAGESHEVSGEELATLLHNHRSLRLVYLNACEGALSSHLSVFSGVAQTLVQQGVPAAVAMQAEITDTAAIDLSRLFYAALAAGYPVDAALTQARVAIAARSAEWAIPVLFSRSPDNRLFDVVDVLPAPDCPYPGMVPFTEKQADVFFGRDKEIADAVDRLRQHPFLTVIGPSGSGKSSLIYAGVIPALRKSRRFGAGEWDMKILRPGAKPVTVLADALAASPEQLASATFNQRTLLFVDQFEELFTLAESSEAQRFLDTLNTLIGKPNLYILLTVRADFYPDLMAASLWQPIRANRLELTPLGDEELRAAILQPAAQVGVTIDEVLVERLVADAAGESGALPLVQETLVLLWEKVERRHLALQAYTAMAEGNRNGLQVAIDRRATVVYENLPDDAKPLARRIFLRLIQFGEGRLDTRRQQTVDELCASGDDLAVFHRTLAKLTESRLLTTSGEEGSARRVDIAHEALIGGWAMLQQWIDEKRVAESTRRRLEEKAGEWLRLGQGFGGLLDAVELSETENWIRSSDALDIGYSSTLEQLIHNSRMRIEEEVRQQEIAKRREEEKEQALRKAHRQRLWILVGATGTLVALVAFFSWLLYEPSTMPPSTFNIAIAEFTSSDQQAAKEAKALAERATQYIENNADDWEGLLGTITIWGPDKVGVVTAETVATKSTAINADIVIYALASPSGDGRLLLEPVFYFNEGFFTNEAADAASNYGFGRPLMLISDNVASLVYATEQLQPRLQALLHLAVGVGYLSFGNETGYQEAERVLNEAISNYDLWQQSESGKEIFYLFLASTLLGQSENSVSEEGRQNLLLRAEEVVNLGLIVNSQFPRLYNALGGILFQRARPPSTNVDDECNWNFDLLDQAETAHSKALNEILRAQTGTETVALRGNLGLGRVLFWKAYCHTGSKYDERPFPEAREYLQTAIKFYQEDPKDYLTMGIATAHQDLGFIALLQAVLSFHGELSPEDFETRVDEANEHYRESIHLATQIASEESIRRASETMPYYIVAWCLADAPANIDALLADFTQDPQLRMEILNRARYTVGPFFGLTNIMEECTNE